jgi:hypothetical protein
VQTRLIDHLLTLSTRVHISMVGILSLQPALVMAQMGGKSYNSSGSNGGEYNSSSNGGEHNSSSNGGQIYYDKDKGQQGE